MSFGRSLRPFHPLTLSRCGLPSHTSSEAGRVGTYLCGLTVSTRVACCVLAHKGDELFSQCYLQGMLRNEDLVAVRVGNSSSGEEGEWRNDNSRLALIVKSNMSPEQRSPTVTFNVCLKSCAPGTCLKLPSALPLDSPPQQMLSASCCVPPGCLHTRYLLRRRQ